MFVVSNSIGDAICKALGLEQVIDCDIALHLDGIAQVTVKYYPDEEHLRAALAVVKEFKLIPIEEEQNANTETE